MNGRTNKCIPMDENNRVCQDFDKFCSYVLDKKVKTTKRTERIGKEDCFELNKLLFVQEKFEKPTRFQNDYPIINYFYYIAVKYQILEYDGAGKEIYKGRNFSFYENATNLERYLLFVLVFLFDHRFEEEGYSWEFDIGYFMEWQAKEKKNKGKKYHVASERVWGRGRKILAFAEELQLLVILKEEKEYILERTSLAELVSTLYQEIYVEEEKSLEVDGLIALYYQEYVKALLPEQEKFVLFNLFKKKSVKKQNQAVDLEVCLRYMECMRVIRMNLSDTLETLHEMIQEAFEFDNDHLYEFYIGQGVMKKTYAVSEYIKYADAKGVEDTTLDELQLKKGTKFSYLFDFGDSWWFDIKVKAVLEDVVDKPKIVQKVNPAPPQYPEYEEEEEWEAVLDDKILISSVLESMEDEYVEDTFDAIKHVGQRPCENNTDNKRKELERLVMEEPDKLLLFMTKEMRELLSRLCEEEIISRYEICTLTKLYSLGLCMYPQKDAYEVFVPQCVKDVYESKIDSISKTDRLTEVAQDILVQCGVIETERLYQFVKGIKKTTLTYEEFEFMIFGRLHYYGNLFFHDIEGQKWMSCYSYEITEQILAERLTDENEKYDYPDFAKKSLKQDTEQPKELKEWITYVKLGLSFDWILKPFFTEEIPCMISSGVYSKDEVYNIYKDAIKKAGSRATKKAEKLLENLYMSLPKATRKGN